VILTVVRQYVKERERERERHELKIFCPYELLRFFVLLVVTVPTQITELATGLQFHYNFPQGWLYDQKIVLTG